MKNPENNLIFFASFASLHCYPSESSKPARILECGGRAQRRHRFSTADRVSKAAWLPPCGIPAAVQKDLVAALPRCALCAFCKCDCLYAIPRDELKKHRGTVALERRRQIVRAIIISHGWNTL